MQRYFAKIINNKVILDDGDVHHLLHVMRMTKGSTIEVVDCGKLYEAYIVSTNPLDISIINEVSCDVELKVPVTLFFALAKGDKIDFVCQKATELGVSRVVLINTKRCITSFENKDVTKKLDRYSKIMKEASEQSHRTIIPSVIGVYDLKNIKPFLCANNYVAYEKDAGFTTNSFNKLNDSISVMIGPEGGFDEKEIEFLKEIGFIETSLGKRILRTETAAIYALSTIAYLLEK